MIEDSKRTESSSFDEARVEQEARHIAESLLNNDFFNFVLFGAPISKRIFRFEEGDIVTYVGDDEDDLDRGNEYEIAQVDEDDLDLPYALHDNEGGYTWVSASDIESID